MTEKQDSSQLMTSSSRDVQLTNHRRQLSADSASSLQISLLLANADDVELNRFSRQVTTSPLASVNDLDTDDVNLLDPSTVSSPRCDDAMLQTAAAAAAAAGTGSLSADDAMSAPDEPLLSNAFSKTPSKYSRLLTGDINLFSFYLI